MSSTPRSAMRWRRAASGSTRRSPRRRSTWSSGCSIATARFPGPTSCGSSRAARQASWRRHRRCAPCASSSRRPSDEGFDAVEVVPFARAPRAGRSPSRSVHRCRRASRRRVGARSCRGRPRRSAPRLRLERRRRCPRARRSGRTPRRRGRRARRGRLLPARRRPAGVLVPPAAPGTAARVRAHARRRPRALGRRRDRRRSPRARRGPRRVIRGDRSCRVTTGRPIAVTEPRARRRPRRLRGARSSSAVVGWGSSTGRVSARWIGWWR